MDRGSDGEQPLLSALHARLHHYRCVGPKPPNQCRSTRLARPWDSREIHCAAIGPSHVQTSACDWGLDLPGRWSSTDASGGADDGQRLQEW